MGNVLNELNEFDKAVMSYNKAIEINPSSEDNYNNLALILSSKDYYLNEAVKSYKKPLKLIRILHQHIIILPRPSEIFKSLMMQ